MGHFSSCGGKLGFPLEVWQGSQGPFALHEGVKPPLEFGEGTQDCSLGTAGTLGHMSRGRRNLLVFLELR